MNSIGREHIAHQRGDHAGRQVLEHDAAQQVPRQEGPFKLVEPRPEQLGKGRPDIVVVDAAVEDEGPPFGRGLEHLAEQVLDVIDVDIPVLHPEHEIGVVGARLLHPDHVVEEKVVAVAGRQPRMGERGPRHHHFLELADLGMDAELHGRNLPQLCESPPAAPMRARCAFSQTWMGIPARMSRKPRNTVSAPAP